MLDERLADSGSSDSGDDAVVGNVNKLFAYPHGYSGPQKKGHLLFDACFESGNLGRVDYITDHEYDLFVRPDTCNPRFRVWFNFTVENVRPDQRVIFNIVNFSKTKSLYREGMSPVVKSSSRPKWTRIPSKNVFYYRCPDHRKNYVMSFAFCFDRADDEVYQFAYSFPYTYSRLQSYLDKLEHKNLQHVKREVLALTVQQRRLDMITITCPENMTSSDKKKIVFVTGRVHPGESPSSHVVQGFLDFIISNHPIARVLREYIIFKVVPMLNPDGVYLGNYRCSLMGFDLNRHWQDPSPWAHPTLHATKQYLMNLHSDRNVVIDFYIDIHAHSTLSNCFMYGNIYDEEERFQRQAIFPRLMCSNADDFSFANTAFNRDVVKAGTGRRFLGGILDESSHCYTLEVSFYSYYNGLSPNPVPYTEESYYRVGRNLAKTFADYYKLSSQPAPKPSMGFIREKDRPTSNKTKTSRMSNATVNATNYDVTNGMPKLHPR